MLFVNVVFLICFKTNHVQIHKPTPLLSVFSLKMQWTKDTLKNTVWNCWCFWRHKLPCIVNEWLSELVWVSGGGTNLHIYRTIY